MSNYDPRVQELLALAVSEGLRLPYPPDYICWLEDRGRIVDLRSGEVYSEVMFTFTLGTSAKAISHLLAHEVGELAL